MIARYELLPYRLIRVSKHYTFNVNSYSFYFRLALLYPSSGDLSRHFTGVYETGLSIARKDWLSFIPRARNQTSELGTEGSLEVSVKGSSRSRANELRPQTAKIAPLGSGFKRRVM